MRATSTTTADRTDAEIIADSIARPEEFGTLFERHFVAVLRYLTRRVGEDRAAELASETFTRAFAARGRYVAHTKDARAWLFGIAENLVRGARRSESRRLRAYARAYGPLEREAAGDANARIDAQRQSAAAMARVRRLPRRQREVLLLHAWGELSTNEIAEALEIPIGTVRSHLSRARAAVAAALTEPSPSTADPARREA